VRHQQRAQAAGASQSPDEFQQFDLMRDVQIRRRFIQQQQLKNFSDVRRERNDALRRVGESQFAIEAIGEFALSGGLNRQR
jgi:hypothetical protein